MIGCRRAFALFVLGIYVILAYVGDMSARESMKGGAGTGTVSWVVQGFESAAIFDKREGVSYLSGVPEEAEVEIWDYRPSGRAKLDPGHSSLAWSVSAVHVREGKGSLRVEFGSANECLRVSLRNNTDSGGKDGKDATSLGFHDYVEGYVFNEGRAPVNAEMRLLGAFSVTDKTIWPALVRTLQLEPGWNRFVIRSEEASAALAGPHDATCIEFRVPGARGQALSFDDFRMVAPGLGPELAARARCFDFGVKRFTFPGFTYGSVPYAAERGYGFTSGTHLEHGGDPHIMDDALTRDGIYVPAAFRLDLPPGKYRVQTQTGNYWARRGSELDVEIRANGRRVYRQPPLTRDESIDHKHFAEESLDIDRPDYDLWTNYEEGLNFRDVAFDVDVKDGRLDLEWNVLHPPKVADHYESIWTYLIVYPVAQAGEVEKGLARLKERIRTGYNRVFHPQFGRIFALYNREEVIAPEEMLWPDLVAQRRARLEVSAEEKERGYLHFLRHRHEFITPYSFPLPGETGGLVESFGAPGQRIFLQVGLYPLRDMGPVTLRMLPLEQAGGEAVVPRDNMDVRLVSYRCLTPVTSGHSETAHIFGPGVLMHSKALMLRADFPRAYHIAVDLPPDLPPGHYEGKAEVMAGDKPLSAVTVRIRVLPIRLSPPADVKLTVSMRWGNMPVASFWDRMFPGRYPGRYPELEVFKSWGMNGIWNGDDPTDLEAMRKWGETYGLDVISANRKAAWGWIWPEHCNPAEAADEAKAGRMLTYFPGSEEGRHQRFTWGFYLWRSPVKYRVMLLQPNTAERVYYAHAGHQKFGPAAYLFPSQEGYGCFNPSPAIYEAADGIQDFSYISTLEATAKSAAAEQKPAADEARAYLDELRTRISPDLAKYYFQRERNFNHVGRWGLRETVWSGAQYDVERWELARRIAKLSGAGVERNGAGEPANGKGLLAYMEKFGPRFEGDLEYWSQSLGAPVHSGARLMTESPKVLATAPVAAISAYAGDDVRDVAWDIVVRSAGGKETGRQRLGQLAAVKTRLFLNLTGLPVGDYVAELAPADRNEERGPKAQAKVSIIPGY